MRASGDSPEARLRDVVDPHDAAVIAGPHGAMTVNFRRRPLPGDAHRVTVCNELRSRWAADYSRSLPEVLDEYEAEALARLGVG